MRFKSRFFKISLALSILIVLVVVSMLWQKRTPEGSKSPGMGIFLARPAFAQESDASFLDREAGIAAYTNMGATLDLSKVKAVFRTVERETDTYIIGSVPIPGYEDYHKEDAHSFVHRDGWVVAYYLEGEPTTKMMDWQKWSSTKLEMGLNAICGSMGSVPPYVRYYHFKYPDATKIMVVVKAAAESFRIMIPGSFTVSERSWLHIWDTGPSGYSDYVSIDGVPITKDRQETESGAYGVYGFIPPVQLTQDTYHTISLTTYRGAKVTLFIALVYREY